LISLTAHRILSACCSRISQILIKYWLSVPIDQPNSTSNIVWVLQSDQPDSDWIFTRCTHRWAWQHIQYCLGVAVESAEHWLNIHSVYPSVSLTVHPILSVCCCRISRTVTEYSLCVPVGQPDSPSNIVCVLQLHQPDSDWIFTRCTHRSAWQPIQYWIALLSDYPDTN